MDPLLDEKIVVTLNRVCADFFAENLYLSADKEAYGPSRNEGLCYESCSRIGFSGDIRADIYFGMDGYTKIKLLPRIAERYQIDPTLKGMAASVLLEFSNQMAADIVEELSDGGYRVELLPPEDVSHKLVRIQADRFRQYIIIFFLRDRRERKYMGRVYLVVAIQKYEVLAAEDEAAESNQSNESDGEE